MAKSKFPRTGINGHFVVFGDEHWLAMEANAVYGQRLSKKIRDLISLATLLLTLMWPEEHASPPLDGLATKRLNQLTGLADQLRSELFSAHTWLPNYQPDYRPRTALGKLLLQLSELREGDDFGLFRVCLGSIIEVGDIINAKATQGTFGHQPGRAWSVWIVLMTLIMDSYGLPSGIRGLSSPFVRLIQYLQNHALQGNKRTHSEGALSKAIQRARESTFFDVKPKEVEGLICRLLGLKEATTALTPNATDMECIVAWVLGERAAGIYPLVPEPLFYSDELQEPVAGAQQAALKPKRRGPKHR